MSDQQEIIHIEKKQFYCDGGEHGHPRVYFTMNTQGFAICNYCNIKYVYKKNDDQLCTFEKKILYIIQDAAGAGPSTTLLSLGG